jgi:hypothetical protein
MPRLVRAILNPNETCAVEVQRRSTGLHATYGLGKSEHANDRFSIVASGGGNPQAAARQFAELGCQILARVDFPGDVSGVHMGLHSKVNAQPTYPTAARLARDQLPAYCLKPQHPYRFVAFGRSNGMSS